ncbi:PREDICTED: cell division cycle-associated protein 2 [Nanorana parkeri]|uniref:cell division cycle-associated protein 2 n=1 Tax=Nanorana parkeri TaxID=125878 RepID=UPI000853F695|nr:PREDICTED: cell division cycle-associated protein 2 [Nanorana parkeri]
MYLTFILGEQRMATRKVLQEIPILPPQTEQQSFVVVKEEAMPDPCTQNFSFPAKAHAKYSSNDESKENITPAAFKNINGEKYKYEKSDVEKQADHTESNNQESSSGLDSDVSLQQKDGGTPMKDIDFSDWRIGESNTPVDFSTATVDDFGITSEKFTNSGGKSPRSLHKHRRRSTIGVRGSPETNYLIRQIALQRSKRQCNPEPLTNPFISPRNSVLKEKMSSFRNAFQAVEENEGKLPFPGFSEEEQETRSDTRESECNGNTSELSEPPGKRKRGYDTSLPKITSVPVKPHAPLLSMQPQETTQEIQKVPVLEKISESAGSSASRLLTDVSKSVDVQIEETQPVPSCTRGQKRKVMFADLPSSPKSKKTLCINEAHKPDCHSFSSPIVLRPVLKKTSMKEFSSSRDELGDQRVCFLVSEPLENENNTLFKKTVNDSVKKRVTFGRELSPELFDKTLPANTPLRKGSTPYRQHASDTATPTTQEANHQSPCQPLAQPDFDCIDEEDTFQPLSLCFDTGSPSKDSTMLLSSPGKEDQVLPTEELEDVTEEHNHHEEDENLLISHDFPENSAAPALDTEIANESFIVFEPDTVPAKSRATRFSNRSKQACSPEDPPTSDNTQTADTSKVQVTTSAKPSSKRSRKHVIKKVQVKAPQVKGKKSRGRPKKSVQKCLYGKRETVSKKPLLSPIVEVPEYHPTPPASTLVSLGGTLNKGFVKSVPKRRGIRKDRGKVQKCNVPSEILNSSDPIILKTEDVTEDGSCPEQEGLEVKLTESLTEGQSHTEPADLVLQVENVSSSTESLLSSADMEVKQDEDLPEPCESFPEDEGTTETMTAPKLQNKSKRRSTTRRRVSQTTTDMPHIANPDLLENIMNADHTTTETRAEDRKPEIDVLVENRAHSPKLPLVTGIAGGKKGRRSSRNFSKSAIFCQSTEPNIHTQDPSTMLPHPDENSIAFTNEPYLPIDEILQDAGTKKVRRSMRLRRDSGASGLFWVQENTSSEGTNRRKSLSSAVQPLGNSNSILKSGSCSPNKEQITVKQVPRAAKQKSLSSAVQSLEGSDLILESVTPSPNKEQLSVHQVPSAAKKTRRRTLCTSTLQQMASLGDTKRRSNISYKDSLSAETQTSHNNITLDT